MTQAEGDETERSFRFAATPAVAQSRARSRYIDCSLCGADHADYLFHKVGIRFVRCRACGLVYVNPVGNVRTNYFEIDGPGAPATKRDRALLIQDFAQFLEKLEELYTRHDGKMPARTLVLGRSLPELAQSEAARRLGVEVVPTSDAEFAELSLNSSLDWAKPTFQKAPSIVILNEFLEACSEPDRVMAELRKLCPKDTWFVVMYANSASLPAVTLRRYWPQFFDVKSAFFSQANVVTLLSRFGLYAQSHLPLPATRTLAHVFERTLPNAKISRALGHKLLRSVTHEFLVGNYASIFRETPNTAPTEKLSIVFPVFNEAEYVEQVIETILAKKLRIEKELVIVESNSTDGTREIVKKFENRPGVQVIFEDRPRGKGHAVRTGLKAVTGSIVLIQDADFEYDIDDYDALLEPIIQRKTSFVLGSRSLGLDDWKVRRFSTGAAIGNTINVAQIVFAKTFNVLYQQHITDVNTMFKVFRTECLDGLDLVCEGFNFDIELACKLVKAGHAPLEVPVNYVARSYAEGKKVSFVRDALPSYWAFFRYRFE